MRFRDFHKQTGIKSTIAQRYMLEIVPLPEKEYPRFPQLKLPEPRLVKRDFWDLLGSRASALSFADRPLALTDIADILHAGGGYNRKRSRPHKAPAYYHPSGGAKYPLEYYLVPFRVEELDEHIYHYRRNGTLEALTAMEKPSVVRSEGILEKRIEGEPAAALIMTAVWGRSYPTYGEFAYRLALTEAGHAAQNMLLAATACGVAARPIMGFDQDVLSRALDIDTDAEDPIYMILLGH